MINNAGIYDYLFFKDIERIINVNLTSVIKNTELCVRWATDSFKRKPLKPFQIVYTSSICGLVSPESDVLPPYIASKFGIVGLTRALKFLGPKFDIRVNCICPAAVESSIYNIDEKLREFLGSENRGGVLSPEDVANALLYIIDNPNVYGQAVTVHSSGIKVEPLDPQGRYSYLGNWDFQKSKKVEKYLDLSIEAIKNGAGWDAKL